MAASKAYQLNEAENYWSGFIYDKDSCSEIVKKFFPGVQTVSMHDRDTVNEARDQLKTVVTSNERHFVRFTREAQNKSIFPRCADCWGLVIIPNVDFQRQHAFAKSEIKSGVPVAGKRLAWKAAMWANLCVKITNDGKVLVQKFERCEHCQRDTPITTDWYKALHSMG